MDLCWWYEGIEDKKERIAHVVSSSERFAGRELYHSYCGDVIVHNAKKEYGNVETAVRKGSRICLECWDKLPNRVLKEITHLP